MSDERHLGGWVKTPPDPRNQNYRIASLVDTALTAQTREWEPGPVLDQGQTSRCVAFGSDDFLSCAPVVNVAVNPDDFYAACQAIDGIPMPHDGTTVHAAMRVLKALGFITSYVWANTEAEIRAWVSTQGPMVIGTDWMNTWFTPTKGGYLSWPKTAQIAGGHCVLICGYDAKRRAYRIQNSWSANWGLGGFAWLRASYLTRLLADGGEAASATEVLHP